MSDRSDFAARLSAHAALAGAIALPLVLALQMPSALDGADSVNFALGLSDFDPVLEQPHFPGYPVYIALCRVLVSAGLPEALALALPGVLASAALVPAQSALGRRMGLAPPVLACASVLLIAQPLLWLEGARPMPDLLATVCIWVALALTAGERPAIGGMLLGLALGIRIDLAPVAAVVLALVGAARARFVLGLALGVGLWLPVFLSTLPPDGLARAVTFARGHFSVWGSTALAGAGGSGVARGLALGWTAPVLPFLALAGIGLAPVALRRFLACALGPYLIWTLLGQNLASARHFLPFAPALALLSACSVTAIPRGVARMAAWTAISAAGITLAIWLPPQHPDGRRLAERALAFCPDCTAIFAGPSERVLAHYAPIGAPLYRRANLAEIRVDLAAWPMLSGDIGVTSELAEGAVLGFPWRQIGPGLRLYRIDASALRLAP